VLYLLLRRGEHMKVIRIPYKYLKDYYIDQERCLKEKECFWFGIKWDKYIKVYRRNTI